MRRRGTTVAAVVGAAVLSLAAGCGIGSGSTTELVVYNAQHEDLVSAMLKGFAKETGINVTLRNGSDFELANQIVQEGSASPADVFLTENSPAMTLVSDKGLFAPLDEDTMAQVPAAFVPVEGRTGSASPPARPCSRTTRSRCRRRSCRRRSWTWRTRSGRARSASPRPAPTSRRSSARWSRSRARARPRPG